MTAVFDSATELADAVIATIGRRIVLGLPVGIGKALHVADALYERAANDSSLSLTIFTGLTLEVPRGGSDLERRFLKPYTDRVYSDWPVPAYAHALRTGKLPDNIEVREFYLRPGAYLGVPLVQQAYTSINYSHVVKELLHLGVNVIAQLVSVQPASPGRCSLSSNPEVTLDLLPHFAKRRRSGEPVALVGEMNRRLPFMTGDAELSQDEFDFLLDDGSDFEPFGLPARPVSAADYATAMHVASLIPDGGTLQIGIGSLSDALAHCLTLRHEQPATFTKTLERLPGGSTSPRRAGLPVHCEPFRQGLFASTELLSDALFALFEAGIVMRQADDEDASVIHAGFYIGTSRFYEKLRSLDATARKLIHMTRISAVNTLYGDETRKRKQRRDAHFINETMLVTLLGAAVSDSLDDGRVVSGVGGQFDFVAMAHELEDARSILMCRARRMSNGKPESNFRWSYAHATVPRHHRDLYVSEYGIADTRGKSDWQVIDAIASIADSAFQGRLIGKAKAARKLPNNYALHEEAGQNTPEALHAVFNHPDIADWFPPFPLGSDFTRTEQELVTALQWLALKTARPAANFRELAAALLQTPARNTHEALARMSLLEPQGLRERIYRRLLAYALKRPQK